MRMFGIVVMSWFLSLSWGQSSSIVQHPLSWEREFSQRPNLYSPEVAVLDSQGVLWILCSARMGYEGYDKQHVTEAMFRIDGNGQQLSTAELGLPLSNEERVETSEYRFSPLPSGEMGLMFNKIHYEARGESYLGAYYAKLGIDGAVGPLRVVGGAGPEYSDFLTLTNGDLLLGGSQGTMISFDSGGAPRWKKSFRQPLLVNPSSANLSDGNICVSAWMLGSTGVLNKLRIMQLDQRGETRHLADIDALRGQVAGGPQGSCAVLYDRAPSVYEGEYHLTVFDHSLGRLDRSRASNIGIGRGVHPRPAGRGISRSDWQHSHRVRLVW